MIDRETLIYTLFLLATFAVQLVVLFATGKRFRPLRFAVPVLAGVAAVVFILGGILTSNGLWEPWISLLAGFLILLGLGLVLIGWMLAWFAYYLINLIKRKASDTP